MFEIAIWSMCQLDDQREIINISTIGLEKTDLIW